MSPESKAMYEREQAIAVCRNWEHASIGELSDACNYVPGAVLLLIRRMGNTRR